VKIDYSYHYNKWYRDTPENARISLKNHLDLYAPHFVSDKNAAVLDVGCGAGDLLVTLRHLGYKNFTGIDIDEGQIQSCRKKNLPVELVPNSLEYLQQHRGAFQQITAFDLIEHIPVEQQLEYAVALCEALQPAGRLLCTTPNANSFLGMRYRYIDWTHHACFTEYSLDFLLHSAGFGKIEIVPAEKVTPPALWFLPTGPARYYWAWRLVRGWRRFQFMVELGPKAGRLVPLSANLLAIADRPQP
jgi:cyclopropane fatty-acyl-phospholipid synthase-like methyltransferase